MQASTKSSTIRYKLSSAFRVDRAHQLRDAPKRGEFLREIAPFGSDAQRRDTGSLVGPDAIAHHLGVTQQIRLDHHHGRHLGDRFGTLSGDPETLRARPPPIHPVWKQREFPKSESLRVVS